MSANTKVLSKSQYWSLRPRAVSRISPTCAKLGKHLHRVIKSLLAKQVEAVQILDVINLLLLIAIRVILHLLGKERKMCRHITAQSSLYGVTNGSKVTVFALMHPLKLKECNKVGPRGEAHRQLKSQLKLLVLKKLLDLAGY